MLRHFGIVDPTISDLRSSALMLSLMGFARDRSLAKDAVDVSKMAAQREMLDAEHLALGFVANGFMTRDRRLARKFFAISEHNSLYRVILVPLMREAMVERFVEFNARTWHQPF